MATYISIDGDNIGDKLAAAYIENDEKKLGAIIQRLGSTLERICDFLRAIPLEIIFCAADGIVCKGTTIDIDSIASYISAVGLPDFTFSVGVGSDLRSSFFALKYAKSIGRNKMVIGSDEGNYKITNLAQ